MRNFTEDTSGKARQSPPHTKVIHILAFIQTVFVVESSNTCRVDEVLIPRKQFTACYYFHPDDSFNKSYTFKLTVLAVTHIVYELSLFLVFRNLMLC